jgi:hypothetical protein
MGTIPEAKMKIIGAVMLLGLVFISPAFGLEKTNPGSSTVSCKCTCLNPLTDQFKQKRGP